MGIGLAVLSAPLLGDGRDGNHVLTSIHHKAAAPAVEADFAREQRHAVRKTSLALRKERQNNLEIN